MVHRNDPSPSSTMLLDWSTGVVKEEMGEKLNEWAIQVEDELKLMLPTTETAAMQQWDKQSIHKVPECVTDLNKKAYKPQFVSFGPYHHMEPHLEPMEKHKRRALLHFLKKSRKPLASYVAALAEVAPNLKDSYESLDPFWDRDTDAFLVMMILDGCFMLEVLRLLHLDDYAPNDPIFSSIGKLHVVPYIRRDMIMLENQLPMLLLTTLLAVEKEGTQQDDGEFHEIVNKLICKFCFPNPWFPYDSSIGKCLHLLDVYRCVSSVENFMVFWFCNQVIRAAFLFQEAGRNEVIRSSTGGNEVIRYRYSMGGNEVIRYSTGGNEVIRSAMELSDAGIRFKKSGSARLDDISFTGGVLSLPPILVDDTTESTFLNLMAFERFHFDLVGDEVTSYIFFMSKIIDSAEDVRLLRAGGIIKNALGSDNDIAKLFDSLSKDVTIDPDSSLCELQRTVNLYWLKRLRRVELMQVQQNYFRNPWSIPAFIAAAFLFLFTLAQTAYAIISYHDPAKN
ncbi:hypothetical protein RHGRI_033286 [Rhododendron griersonianum]|uniref:Uncharacterized protein n=1 Tax=Rhododendron griersonianum TaxID=479676 RepID=A0AAV6HWN0_9ERIC|nr:hypothetical protein RHGRI_033286 [Rhododendron griersonianum]